MSLRTRTLPSILNGVSKQPAILRAADQNADELNTWSSLSDGLGKRPPGTLVAKLSATISGSAFIHYINRDTTERYCVVIDDGAIRVFDIQDGSEKTVNAPEGYGYLAGGENYRAITVADYTFIVNTEVFCELAGAGADTVADPLTYRWLNRGTADAVYNPNLFGVNLTGGVAQYPTNYSAGNYVGEVASIEKLPEDAANGTMYKITGSVETGFVSYYVRRNGAVWDETVANGQVNALNAETMPHALVSEADGTFTFAPFSWAPRRVGDADSNPPATFVGRAISDVFFYQNRLGFLVDENIVFSCAGDFGNFWRSTVLDYIDSDVVDHAVATTSVSLLNYAVSFNDGIMAFADQTQFSIENGEDGLTPSSLAISPVTSYEMNTKVRPAKIGSEVYFCGNQNGHSVVWEYTKIEQGDSLIASEISAHVPGFIPANAVEIAAAPNAKAIFVLTGGNDVYPYQFYWNGNEKIQSAWRKWTFEGQVIAAKHMDDSLYAVTRRDDGTYLMRIDLEEGATSEGVDRQVFLDMQVSLTASYNGVSDQTTYTFPYKPKADKVRLIRTTSGETQSSLIDPSTYIWSPNGLSVQVPGSEGTVIAGESYTQSFTFSEQFHLDYQGRPMVSGRLQLRTFSLTYSNTAFFRTEVSPYGKAMSPDVETVVPALLADFTGKVVGDASLVTGVPATHTGSYAFQVYGDASQATITISNDTHLGATFTSAEWEGFYFNRAQA